MTPTETRLVEILSQGLKLQNPQLITSATRIFGKDGLGLDSVDVLEIAVLLDKHFGVMLQEQNDEVHSALYSIGTLAAYVDKHKAA